MMLSVSFTFGDATAEVTLDDVDHYSPDILADCCARCVATVVTWTQRLHDMADDA